MQQATLFANGVAKLVHRQVISGVIPAVSLMCTNSKYGQTILKFRSIRSIQFNKETISLQLLILFEIEKTPCVVGTQERTSTHGNVHSLSFIA